MADVGKLISLGNLLVRKVTWVLLTIMSATLILSRAFGADHLTRIAYIYLIFQELTLSHFDLQRQHSLSLFISTSRNSLILPLNNTIQYNICNMGVYILSATFFLPVLPFQLDLFQPRTQPQKFCQIPKETNNQHGRRHVPPRIHCYIFVYWYLTWNSSSTYIL